MIMKTIKSWFTPPTIEGNPDRSFRISLTNGAILAVMVLWILIIITNSFGRWHTFLAILVLVVGTLCAVILQRLVVIGKEKLAGAGIIILSWITITSFLASLGTIRAPATTGYLLVVMMAGLLFEWRGTLLTSVAIILAVTGLAIAQNRGLLPPANYSVAAVHVINFALVIVACAAITQYTLRTLKTANKRAISEIQNSKQQEIEHLKIEERYRLLTAITRDVIWVMDLASNKFVYVNPAVYQLRGYTPEEVMSQPVDSSLTPNSLRIMRKTVEENLKAYYAGRPSVYRSVELEQPCKNGTTVWTEVMANFIFDDQNKPIQVLGISRDISERRIANEKLKASEERYRSLSAELEQRVHERTSELEKTNQTLEKALQSKDEMIRLMSHELRTPLTGILGMSQALQLPALGELNSKQLSAVENIEKSGQQLLAQINDILDFSRLQTGNITLESRPVSLENMCRGALRSVTSSLAEAKSQKTHFSCSPESITIQADEKRLQQVLNNLYGTLPSSRRLAGNSVSMSPGRKTGILSASLFGIKGLE
jgi:PAS domain S-box-containing protein